MITIGSLCSGIGGLELGLERALGARVVWQVEIDEWCRRVLAKHWPNVDRSVTDVRQAGSTRLVRADVVCAGFPCQDLSVAGNSARDGRRGLDGAPSGLAWEVLRVVDELRPGVVVLENSGHAWRSWVPQLRSALHDFRYASVPIRVSAGDVGAPHQRARCFVVAHANGEPLRQRAERMPGRRPRDVRGSGIALAEHARSTWSPSGWTGRPSSAVRRVADGISPRVDGRGLTALGNAVVSQVAERVALAIEVTR